MIINATHRQQGLTLLELLIAIALGLFVAGAMIALFVNSKQSYRINENMSRLQENARFAVSFLSRDIRMADYSPCAQGTIRSDAISGENNSGLNSSDTITIVWDENTCASPTTITTVYSIAAGTGGIPSLFRSVNGADPVELIQGIEDLQVLYGEDTNDDDVADYYVDASSITDMARVISVRYTLVARTLESGLTTGGDRVTRDFSSNVTLRNRIP